VVERGAPEVIRVMDDQQLSEEWGPKKESRAIREFPPLGESQEADKRRYSIDEKPSYQLT
jgi:hypothetical protein